MAAQAAAAPLGYEIAALGPVIISAMRSCGNGWAAILIRRPFRSMTSTGDSHPCSATGQKTRTPEPSSSSAQLGYAGLPKAHVVLHENITISALA